MHILISRVFRDPDFHRRLDDLVTLTLYLTLSPGVSGSAIPPCSPLEPLLINTLAGVKTLRLTPDDQVLLS